MTVWSKTGIAHQIIELDTGEFAICDKAGARIDWPLISRRSRAEVELAQFIVEYRKLRNAETSEAFGLRHMQAVTEEGR